MIGFGDNIRRIRVKKGLSLRDAGKLLNMSATAISKYENGFIKPDSNKIIEFSKAYDCKPIELIQIFDVPDLKFDSFRSNKRLTGEKLEILKEDITAYTSNYIDVLTFSNLDNKLILDKYVCKNKKDIDKASISIRKILGINNNQPIINLIDLLESNGINVILIKNDNDFYKGFHGCVEYVSAMPFIYILEDDDYSGVRFTLAHELGHLILDVKNMDTEEACDYFAYSLLTPDTSIYSYIGTRRTYINSNELDIYCKKYHVSYLNLIHRLKQLNVVSSYSYKQLLSNTNNFKYKVEKEEPTRYKQLIYKLQAQDEISISKASELLGVNVFEYTK